MTRVVVQKVIITKKRIFLLILRRKVFEGMLIEPKDWQFEISISSPFIPQNNENRDD